MSNKIYLPNHWNTRHNTLHPLSIMCFVSLAIAPREPWMESRLGEWYWDDPWHFLAPFPPPPEGSGPDELYKRQQSNKQQWGTLLASEGAASAAHHRAPPRERPFSTGTTASNRASHSPCILRHSLTIFAHALVRRAVRREPAQEAQA